MSKHRTVEKIYPWAVSAALALAYFVYSLLQGEPMLEKGERREFLSMVIDVGAIAVGFIGAMMGIVMSIDDKPAIRHLHRSGTHDDLIDHLGWAAVSCLILVVYSLCIVGATAAKLYITQFPKLHAGATTLWLFMACFSVLSSLRILLFFWIVLKYREPDTSPQLGSDPTR